MLLDFGRANWFRKARSQPDKVKMVLDKARADGVAATIESVRAKLNQPIALGYSAAGIVVEAGSETPFRKGERVAANGGHAEIAQVPANLCARIPDSVNDEAAAFTVIGAIALEGIRLIQPALGEFIVVTGLGLIGLIAVQLLRANGCRVLGVDFDLHRLRLAEQFGAEVANLSAGEDAVGVANRLSRGRGVDAVLITAATKSNEPVHQAALMCRKRARVVLVGTSGLQLSRDDFYKKELSFQVSCSYGPGRYDPAFEQGGQDYPYPYVRWTAQRNFEAVLETMSAGKLDTASLISHRFSIENATAAYDLIRSGERHLGIVLEYGNDQAIAGSGILRRTLRLCAPRAETAANVGFIGAGAYSTKVLIPAFKDARARLAVVVSAGGVSAAHAARRFGFECASTEVEEALEDASLDTVVIATRHNSHAELVCRAIRAGKHVFVEKPIATIPGDLDEIESLYNSLHAPPLLMVGFNRRFAPQVVKMRMLLQSVRDQKSIVITVNAGSIPADHWSHDPAVGAGRIIGECCHFVDLARFLAGNPIVNAQTSGAQGLCRDTVQVLLEFTDGSTAAIHYITGGHKSFPKERIEVFAGGRILRLDNFRILTGWGWPGFHTMKLWRQDKGNAACVAAFVDAIRFGRPSPILFEEIVEVGHTTLEVASRCSRP